MTPLRVLALAISLLLLGAPQGEAELRVVATSKPAHALAAAVMNGVATPALLVDGPASPHSYAMRPSDAQKINRADVFIRISEALEPFTAKIVRALPPSVAVVTLEEAPGIKLLPRRMGGAFEAAGHTHASGHGHNEPPRRIDPHIWLDPDNAKAMVTMIAEVLAAREPDQSQRFRANADALRRKLDDLAGDLERELRPVAGKPFIVYHDAYQYLERRYGLLTAGSVTIDPDQPPSGRRLQELRGRIRSAGVSCVFAEPHLQGRVAGALIEGTGTRLGILDPEGTTLSPGPDLYFELMRRLAQGLSACLSG
jgi:zinc transport system substrate-binding protein